MLAYSAALSSEHSSMMIAGFAQSAQKSAE